MTLVADNARWTALQAELRASEARYRAASHARDVYVSEAKTAGATWGELSKVTSLDRGQLVRMARRAQGGNDSQ